MVFEARRNGFGAVTVALNELDGFLLFFFKAPLLELLKVAEHQVITIIGVRRASKEGLGSHGERLAFSARLMRDFGRKLGHKGATRQHGGRRRRYRGMVGAVLLWEVIWGSSGRDTVHFESVLGAHDGGGIEQTKGLRATSNLVCGRRVPKA